MIPKSGKPPEEVTSYRPISLLPIISKLFEKLLLERLKPIIERKHIIPSHQFGFREEHSTIDQVHRITDIIEKCLEEKKICSTIFLDVAQAFDKVWHRGLEIKMRKLLPKPFSQLLKSYISDRHFRIRQEDISTSLRRINAGVPQGSVLGPILYLIYTSDVPRCRGTTIATFADDTAILSTGTTIEEATNKLQNAINKVTNWTKKWRIKLNENKSQLMNFTNRKYVNQSVKINGKIIPVANTAKYLGMTLDSKLRWKEHVKIKRKELNLKFSRMYWLLGRHSQLSIYNKLLIYQQVLKPVWTYGIQLWGCAKRTHILTIQKFQNKVLRCVVDSPRYMRMDRLHLDLNIKTVEEIIADYAKKHQQRLSTHRNTAMEKLLDFTGTIRRLKRKKPADLVPA